VEEHGAFFDVGEVAHGEIRVVGDGDGVVLKNKIKKSECKYIVIRWSVMTVHN
jgi:hypothetical protein